MPKEFILASEAARLLDVSKDTVRRLVDSGRIKSARVSHIRIIDAEDVRRFMRQRDAARTAVKVKGNSA